MRKFVALILIGIMISTISFGFDEMDIFVPELRPTDSSGEIDEEIFGASNGYEVIFNSVFRDIGSATYEKEIVKLAAEGIVEKYGDFDFNPEKNITGYEALTFLVRFLGNEDVVQQNVLANAAGLDLSTITNMYNQEYLNQAQNLGIIIPSELIYVNKDITKEILVKWVFRVSNLEEQFNDLSEVFGFKDWVDVEPADRGIVQAMASEGIIGYDNDGRFNSKNNVTRGQMASIIDKLSTSMYEERNIKSQFGLIMNIVDRTQDNETIKDIYIKNADDTITKVTTKKNNDSNKQNEFVTYKNGIVSSSRNLKIGDEINYFIKDNEVYFAEVLNDNSVLLKIREIQKSEEDSNLLLATVKEIYEEKDNNGITIINKKRIRIATINGNTYDLIIETDLATGIKKDVLVYKDGSASGTDLLEIGDKLELLVKNDNKVIYIKVSDFETELVSGTIREANESYIEVFDYNDRVVKYPVSKYCEIEINRRPGEIGNLEYGQDVKLEINNGYITHINSETFINPGYIPEFGKVKTGKVFRRYASGTYFELNNGDKEFYKITEDTILLKEGRNIEEIALKEGDKVKLYFNDIYTDEISKLEVEGQERLIKQVYKGTLDSLNEGNMTITLSQVSYLKNTDWIDLDSYSKEISIDDNIEIYNSDELVKLQDLIKKFKDKTIYMVVENSYDNENGIKIAIKNGGENVWSDRIDTIDKTISKFELQNNQNVNYNNGTIVIKDGRLIPNELLSKYDSVLVVSEFYKGAMSANLIKVTTMSDKIFDNIYFGTLEDVNYNSITMKNYTSISGNEFNQINPSESRKYYYFTETTMKDITDETDIKELDRNDLFHGSYSRVENKSEDSIGVPYEKYYTYFVTNGNLGIIGMNLRHLGLLRNQDIDNGNTTIEKANEELYDTLNKAVFTRGVLTEKMDIYHRYKITDTHDYMGYQGGWVPNDSDTYFEYSDAVIIKNNKEIKPSEVEIGNYLYLMRIKEDALIIIVEDD
ncbi:MAG: S-layer homology domain-containing protein [Bacillota bacterium]|nr:S-layer homology domain-containing protein [Bacillota bacterium]